MASHPTALWQIDGETMRQWETLFSWAPKSQQYGDYSREIEGCLPLGRKAMTNLDSILKKQRHYLADSGPNSKNYDFSSRHVWMWELDHKEGWQPKNRCFWTVVLEKILESPLDCKEIQPVHPKGNQPWIYIGKINAEAEAPIFWPPKAKSQLIRKYPDAGNYWREEEKGERGWDGWMASLIHGTWVWASSGKLWRTGKRGVLLSMRSQRIRYDWANEQQQPLWRTVWRFLKI